MKNAALSFLTATAAAAVAMTAAPRTASASDVSCQNPTRTADVVQCVERFHPDVKKLEFDGAQIEGVRKSATQIPNPQVSFQTTRGHSFGDLIAEDALSVSELIEIGGKRAARRKAGDAQEESLRASGDLTRAQARMQALLQLIRYRQLKDEIAVLNEALTTFGKVHDQFAARPRLSPDQQVTFSLFKLSMGDYRHRQAALEAELRKTENFFRLVPQLDVEQALRFLPKRMAKWPAIASSPIDVQRSPAARIATSEIAQARAAQDLANANAVPDPTVSLIGIRNVEGAALYYRYGVGVTLPLPLLNLNGGERSQAAAQKAKAEIEYAKVTRQLQLDRDNLVVSYQAFVKALEAAPSPKEIDSKHRNTESLFYRGVVSGVMVIEAHRQILDFTQSQNELEYETAQALMGLYLLDGKLGGFNYE